MRLKYKILLALIVALVAICLSPFLVGPGVRVWIWWQGRQEKLTVKIDKIDAPFLQPVLFRGVQVKSLPNAAYRVELSATQASVSLNFNAILLGARGRALRNLSVTGLRAEIHHNENGTPFPETTWETWQKLLPDGVKMDGLDLRLEDGPTVILLRGGGLTASEIASGRCNAGELTISSPVVRQTFSNLRGTARWQNNYLTLAGLTLVRGLYVQWITADLAHLGKQHLGLEFDLDAFDGKIRGDISNEWRSNRSNWNIASSANDISLGQTAEAIGFADRVAGRLHAGKFTFRGDPHDPVRATASLWTELTAPAWRNREADVLMFGAAFYNRQIDLQQLYVKQNKNQLTLSGEASFPEKSFDWFNPDFRATISASIKNLDDFTALFGATRGEFAGEIAINGTLNARDRKVGGHITASGAALTVFKMPIDAFSATLNLKTTQFELEELKLSRGEDFLRSECKIDIGQTRNVAGSLEFSIRKLSDYFSKSLFPGALTGRFNFNGHAATSDSFQLSDGATTTPLSATIDLADLGNVSATLMPLNPIFDLSAANAADCIDQVEVVPSPSTKQPAAPIEKIEVRGDFVSGPREIKTKTDATEKTYRVSCPDGSNRALAIGVAAEKRP